MMLALLLACTAPKDSATTGDSATDGDSATAEDSATTEETLTTYEGQPILQLDPTDIDFGIVPAGEEREQEVTIRNVGTASLQLDELSVTESDQPFTLSSLLSVIVLPEHTTTFMVHYTPMIAGMYASDVRIRCNDPQEIHTLSLAGVAE